jgi:SAM-dependent methyltransferase
MDGGWDESAAAWIAAQGDGGDFTRRYVTDPVMLASIRARGVGRALDIGCGEGRFCRMMRAEGIAAIGIDPTAEFIAEACRRDPAGDYRVGRAEALDFADGAFDLVVSYLALIDIPDVAAAITEMARVLAPGGTLLIVNLASFATACADRGWVKDWRGAKLHFPVDHYLEERAVTVAWGGIRVINRHRPLSTYMGLLLGQGLRLTQFVEPRPIGGDPRQAADYERAPWAYVMEWRKDLIQQV